MKLYTDYVDLLHEHGLLKQTFTGALKIWTCSGFAHLFDLLKPNSILEIGRCDGHSLGLFRFLAPEALIVSVDPAPRPHAQKVIDFMDERARSQGHDPKTVFIDKTSDAAFAGGGGIGEYRYDFALIDGDHTYEGAKRDWENTKPLMVKNGVVAFDNTEMKCGKVFYEIKDLETVQPFHINFRADPADGGQYGFVFMGERP
jgi:predicted O-methyltransferase YrrM